MEKALLVDFRAAINRRGLRLAAGAPTFTPVSPVDDKVRELRGGVDDWLSPDWVPLAALAQHYGLPTRLLDWTFSSSIAAFFAARSAFKALQATSAREALDAGRRPDDEDVSSRDATGQLAVWRIDATRKGFDDRLEIIHPPYADNPNLSAQQGVFTHWREFEPQLDAEVDRRPLDERLGGASNVRLTKVTLPATLAATLLVLLSNRGVDGGSAFPGYGGVAQALLETTLADRAGLARKWQGKWSEAF